MTGSRLFIGVVPLAALLGGCTTVERNQVALGLCARASWCTASERERESGPPQVRALQGPTKERILNPQK